MKPKTIETQFFFSALRATTTVTIPIASKTTPKKTAVATACAAFIASLFLCVKKQFAFACQRSYWLWLVRVQQKEPEAAFKPI